jgi:ethanolamine ammonia-lyase small subunit
LNDDSRQVLQFCAAALRTEPDVAFVIADGLSVLAIEANAINLLDVMSPKLTEGGRHVAPIAIVEQGRVAVGDKIGEMA